VVLRLRGGPRFELRGGRNNDFGVAYELFIHRVYALPPGLRRDQVRRIVDLGANVGFSLLHWLHHFPQARIVAWEPLPSHLEQIRRNLALNGWQDRVELHAAAAGPAVGMLRLTDEGTSAQVREDGAIAVPVEDVFEQLGGGPIDLLKVDIEGAEYPILADPRFAALQVGAAVMEWHGRADPDADLAFCIERLGALGLAPHEISRDPAHGMFWALPAA
jgi:FkbM family methyltransferase